jgi:peptidoglycan pentaglycine glycine transferase (the first glycine)
LTLEVNISTSSEDIMWDKFVTDCPGGHHVQTSLWSQVKAILGWDVIRITLTDKDEIVAGAQMLTNYFPILGKAGYITKGPLCRDQNPELVNSIIDQVISLCKVNHLRFLAVQAPNKGSYIETLLAMRKFRESKLELAPRASILLDLTKGEDGILSEVKRQTRQNIRRSIREGIHIREGSKSDIETFYDLHLLTSKRQNFLPYPKKYFERMWEILSPGNHIQLLWQSSRVKLSQDFYLSNFKAL